MGLYLRCVRCTWGACGFVPEMFGFVPGVAWGYTLGYVGLYQVSGCGVGLYLGVYGFVPGGVWGCTCCGVDGLEGDDSHVVGAGAGAHEDLGAHVRGILADGGDLCAQVPLQHRL